MRYFSRFVLILLAVAVPAAGFTLLQRDAPPHPKATVPAANDAVTALQRKIDSGAAKLNFDEKQGYLRSLLTLFHIPFSSQTLVFSKSSFELQLISPTRPRALYFNDDVYVGWVRGADEIEVTAEDPKLGPVFYTLTQTNTAKPHFRARSAVDCLVCHDFEVSRDPIPRLLMLSVLPDPNGAAIGGTSLITNDKSPLRERWGGWYVTGTLGDQRDLGNMVVHEPASEKIDIKEYAASHDLDSGANITNLNGAFDTSQYLTPYSDIVALMLLGHQTQIHNLITFAEYRLKTAGADKSKVVAEAGEPLVEAMLFSGAISFTNPIKGNSGFAAEFSSLGPADSHGRSLRQLDLQHRLMKYPLSYLVYSSSFDGMPPELKQYIYRRFHEILSGQDSSAKFAHLSADDRQAILGILSETKPDFVAVK